LQVERGRVFREAWIASVTTYYPGEPKPSYLTPWDDTPSWEPGRSAKSFWLVIEGFRGLVPGPGWSEAGLGCF